MRPIILNQTRKMVLLVWLIKVAMVERGGPVMPKPRRQSTIISEFWIRVWRSFSFRLGAWWIFMGSCFSVLYCSKGTPDRFLVFLERSTSILW